MAKRKSTGKKEAKSNEKRVTEASGQTRELNWVRQDDLDGLRYYAAEDVIAVSIEQLVKQLGPYLDGPVPVEEAICSDCSDNWISIDHHDFLQPRPLRGMKVYWVRNKHPIAGRLSRTLIMGQTLWRQLRHGDDIDLLLNSAMQFGEGSANSFTENHYWSYQLPKLRSYAASQKGRRKAGNTTNEIFVELHDRYREDVRKLMQTGVKYTPATEQVAATYGVHARTVQRNTRELSPRAK